MQLVLDLDSLVVYRTWGSNTLIKYITKLSHKCTIINRAVEYDLVLFGCNASYHV